MDGLCSYMNNDNSDKKYQSYKIPQKETFIKMSIEIEKDRETAKKQEKRSKEINRDMGLFYEIEYDASPIEGVGKFVLKSQKIEATAKDEIKERFYQMRDISRNHRIDFGFNQLFDMHVSHNRAVVFHKQAVFMQDFEDDYSEEVHFSSYFPNYQMMGYEQLRSYFTWRTRVRKDEVRDTSLSYAFLYIYELINNIAVESPQEGLEKLMSFWKAFRVYNKVIDKYVVRWLKDYHIYYELGESFKEFVMKNKLSEHYLKIVDINEHFDLLCVISKYDIRKSVFFVDNQNLVTECFNYVIKKIKKLFLKHGIHFDNSIFSPTKKMSTWTPFKDALFYDKRKQNDRRVVLSQNEIYVCYGNKWEFSSVLTTESGRQLIGYIMKQTESVLRKLKRYKFHIKADGTMLTHPIVDQLNMIGFSLEDIVNKAVNEYYKEKTKIVIKVDHNSLSKIREDALTTQEKLIVEEVEIKAAVMEQPKPEKSKKSKKSVNNEWEALYLLLSEVEVEAVHVLLDGGDIKKFSDENGIMLEVLIDGLNDKAMDFVGDNIIDDEFNIYEDYIENVKEMVGI